MQLQQSDIFGYVPPVVEEAPPAPPPKPKPRKDLTPSELLKALDGEIDDMLLEQIIEKAESIRQSKLLVQRKDELKEAIDQLDAIQIDRILKFIESGCPESIQRTAPRTSSSSPSSRGDEITLAASHCDTKSILESIPVSEAESIALGDLLLKLGIDRNDKSYIQKFKRQVFSRLLEDGSVLASGSGRNTRYHRPH